MYAALYIPRFALQSILRAEATEAAAAVALVSGGDSRALVLELTDEAKGEGVTVGLTVPQALARCAALRIVHRSHQAEEVSWQALHRGAYSLSPRVERVSDGLLLVDLRGRVLEEAKQDCVSIVERLGRLGLVVRVGLSPAYSTALLAAKQSRGLLAIGLKVEQCADGRGRIDYLTNDSFLQSLPIEAAEPGENLLEILRKWGLRTVGSFATLKRVAVANRLGMEGLDLWDRVNGRDRRVIGVVELPLVFEVSWEFEYAIDSLEPLQFLMRRFLEQLCFEMGAAHKQAAVLVLQLGLAYGEPLFVEQKIPEPTIDVEALFRALTGQLDSLEVESPVDRFSIRIDVVDFKQRQFGLFETSLRNPNRLGQTLAKVAGIVGSERVGRPVLPESGAPDGARMTELVAFAEVDGDSSLKTHYGLPLRRFRPVLNAEVKLRGSRPAWVQCARISDWVGACQGPWVHSGHWWEEEGSWNRVEWDVELRSGGVYRLVRERGAWFLEGEYD